ncbi:MAG: hypothetical protein WKF76_10505 [Nocardioidaceae bacterium]
MPAPGDVRREHGDLATMPSCTASAKSCAEPGVQRVDVGLRQALGRELRSPRPYVRRPHR